MDKNEMDTVTLYLDDDRTLDCQILCYLTVGGQEYIALLPPDGDEGEESPVYFYRFLVGENDQPQLDNITEDEEYEQVCDAFEEWMNAQDSDLTDLDALDLDSLE